VGARQIITWICKDYKKRGETTRRLLVIIIPPIIPLVSNAAPNITDPPFPNLKPHNLDTANVESLSITEPRNQLRRSSRSCQATNFDDLITYFTEVEDIGKLTDPISY
jgi:hypothetical protein